MQEKKTVIFEIMLPSGGMAGLNFCLVFLEFIQTINQHMDLDFYDSSKIHSFYGVSVGSFLCSFFATDHKDRTYKQLRLNTLKGVLGLSICPCNKILLSLFQATQMVQENLKRNLNPIMKKIEKETQLSAFSLSEMKNKLFAFAANQIIDRDHYPVSFAEAIVASGSMLFPFSVNKQLYTDSGYSQFESGVIKRIATNKNDNAFIFFFQSTSRRTKKNSTQHNTLFIREKIFQMRVRSVSAHTIINCILMKKLFQRLKKMVTLLIFSYRNINFINPFERNKKITKESLENFQAQLKKDPHQSFFQQAKIVIDQILS